MNHAIFKKTFFTELKTIPMMIVVTVHSGMETIAKVIKKKTNIAKHANTQIDITVTVFLRNCFKKKYMYSISCYLNGVTQIVLLGILETIALMYVPHIPTDNCVVSHVNVHHVITYSVA